MVNHLKAGVLMLSLLIMSACTGPETPQEVTEAFWQSVVENDADTVATLSTLSDADRYTGLEADWPAASIRLGRVVIDDREATVVTEFQGIEGTANESREVRTYLVRRGEDWKVDFERTREAFTARSAFHNLMGEIDRFSDRLSASFDRSSDAAAQRMEELATELRALSDAASDQASETLEAYSERLRKQIQELKESIEEALKEEKPVSPEAREQMEASVQELDTQNQQLADPDLQTLAASSQSVAATHLRLQALDQDDLSRYQQKWQAQIEAIQEELKQLVEEITARSSESGSS